MPDLSPAETLRAAAARLRELAKRTTFPRWQPWEFNRTEADAVWITVLQPVVAGPLVAELETHADLIDLVEKRGDDASAVVQRAANMLAFARWVVSAP